MRGEAYAGVQELTRTWDRVDSEMGGTDPGTGEAYAGVQELTRTVRPPLRYPRHYVHHSNYGEFAAINFPPHTRLAGAGNRKNRNGYGWEAAIGCIVSKFGYISGPKCCSYEKIPFFRLHRLLPGRFPR
jgi:hypothetical protein